MLANAHPCYFSQPLRSRCRQESDVCSEWMMPAHVKKWLEFCLSLLQTGQTFIFCGDVSVVVVVKSLKSAMPSDLGLSLGKGHFNISRSYVPADCSFLLYSAAPLCLYLPSQMLQILQLQVKEGLMFFVVVMCQSIHF